MKKGLRPTRRCFELNTRADRNPDLMKKGLRPTFWLNPTSALRPKPRPDEEGIKTFGGIFIFEGDRDRNPDLMKKGLRLVHADTVARAHRTETQT